MALTGYKYAERDADSQVNWAEVGKGLTDMIAETTRVREEKKAALDENYRDTMKFLAETPNGEDVGARTSMLTYANKVSNRVRIANQMLKNGQMSVKDYTIFMQNITDNTNLGFNANKVYQERYSDVMKGVADKKYSQLYADNFSEAEAFAKWGNVEWEIAPDGVVMIAKTKEEIVDGKKIRTVDRSPEGLRSMNYLNQALVSPVDFYKWDEKVNEWVETLGKEKTLTKIDLGGIERKGIIRSRTDITNRTDIDPITKKSLYTFIDGENSRIDSIVGRPFDAARVLTDSTIFAPNGKQYRSTTSEKDAKANPEAILKVVDTETGGFKYIISEEQQKEANEFIRGQMRSQYIYEEDAEVVGQTSRDESAETKARVANKYSSTGGKNVKTTPPVTPRKITQITETNKRTNKKTTIGISQRLENLNFTEADGIEYVITDVGYNGKTGALEARGYQKSGKQTESEEEDVAVESVEDGKKVSTPKTVKKGKNSTGRINFLKNDINSIGLLTSIAPRTPNPADPNGGNFEDVEQMKAYYKGEYEKLTGKKELD
jgi:hypothetical protein